MGAFYSAQYILYLIQKGFYYLNAPIFWWKMYSIQGRELTETAATLNIFHFICDLTEVVKPLSLLNFAKGLN